MMKFYATTKSERTIKGQGGNEYLDITLNTEYIRLARIVVKKTGDAVDIHYQVEAPGHATHWIPILRLTEAEIAKIKDAACS